MSMREEVLRHVEGVVPMWFGLYFATGVHLEGNLTLKPLGQPARRLDYPHDRTGFAGDCVCALQRHFVDRLRDGGAFESTGEDYLRTVALVEACYRSHASGQVEPVGNPT